MAITTYGDPYEVLPVSRAPVPARVAYLRKLGLLTLVSLGITTISAISSMVVIASVPVLQNQWAALALMLGGIYGGQMIGGSMVVSREASTRWLGFILGSGMAGISVSYLLMAAAVLGQAQLGSPLAFIAQAGGLVVLTVLGMVIYLMTGPRELSMVGSALSVLTLPMLGLMVITFFFPVGGIFGIGLSALFVLVSAGGLLYNLNEVMHRMSTEMVLAGAFHVSFGVIVLFWNVLTLLMRLQRD